MCGIITNPPLPPNVTTQGNTFNGDNELVQTDGSGVIPDSVLPGDVTLQGNTFNGPDELLQLNSVGAVVSYQIDMEQGKLFRDGGTVLAVDLQNDGGRDDQGRPSMDWKFRHAINDAGTVTLDYEVQHLNDAGGNLSANWNSRVLQGQWQCTSGFSPGSTFDVTNAALYNGAGVPSGTPAQGSYYFRKDPSGPLTRIYVYDSGAWTGII